MKPLPQDIRKVFYKVLKRDLSLSDFEKWLIEAELEKYLGEEDYIDLISLGLKKKEAKYELDKLLKKHIDLGAFEASKMLEILREAKEKNGKLPYILMEFYDLYCKGYSFLKDLGIGFGLRVTVPNLNNSMIADSWEELSSEQQENLLSSFSPELEECIEKVIDWLNTGKIILTGKKNEVYQYTYVDLRAEDEKS